MPTLSVDVKVFCETCGAGLIAITHQFAEQGAVFARPCCVCLAAEKQAGRKAEKASAASSACCATQEPRDG